LVTRSSQRRDEIVIDQGARDRKLRARQTPSRNSAETIVWWRPRARLSVVTTSKRAETDYSSRCGARARAEATLPSGAPRASRWKPRASAADNAGRPSAEAACPAGWYATSIDSVRSVRCVITDRITVGAPLMRQVRWCAVLLSRYLSQLGLRDRCGPRCLYWSLCCLRRAGVLCFCS